MVSEEVKGVINIAISLIVLSIVLTFIMVVMNIRSDLATFRNTEILSAKNISEYREFNKYNGKMVYGEDVVCAIRDFYNRGIRIRVNSTDGDYEIDKYMAREDKSLVDIDELRVKFPVTKKYYAVVVYGQVDLGSISELYTPDTINNNVGGIVFFDKGAR